MRKAFSFYRSHYEQMKLLNQKQISDITMAICEVQFLETNIDDISFDDKMTQLVWTGIKHGIDASVKGYTNKKGDVEIPLARGSENVSTPLEQEKGEEKEKEKEKGKEVATLPEWISIAAWHQWEQHRKELKKKLTPSTIKKQLGFLSKHQEDHIEIIEQSIQNGWVGLFALKQQNSFKGKEPEIGSLNWQIAQEAKEADYVEVQIESC